MRMSASSSTMRISLAMPCSSFHSRHLVVVVRLPAAAVGHFFAQREDEADARAATFPLARNQIASVFLPALLHNFEAKSSAPLARGVIGLGQAAAHHIGQAEAVVGDCEYPEIGRATCRDRRW